MIEAIVEFLVAPIVFWLLSVVAFIVLIFKSEEEGLWGGIWIAVAGSSLWVAKYGSFAGLWDYIVEHPILIALWTGLYLVVGTVWSFYKWYNFAQEEVKRYTTLYSDKAPDPGNEKERIITWIVLWVPSLTWFLINDPVRRLANSIYESLSGVYESISNKAYEKAKQKEKAVK